MQHATSTEFTPKISLENQCIYYYLKYFVSDILGVNSVMNIYISIHPLNLRNVGRYTYSVGTTHSPTSKKS